MKAEPATRDSGLATFHFRRILVVTVHVVMSLVMLTIFALVALLTVARAQHWVFNGTTCMPLGFYRLGPKPKVVRDGDYVMLCPDLGNPLHLRFAGAQAYQKSLPADTNPAMAQAISGNWLEFSPKGPCAKGIMPFAKVVAAIPGQQVMVAPQGVRANGRWLPNSAVVTRVDGIPVIHVAYGRYVVPKGYIWDYAPGNFAYTSAYYGPIPEDHILGSLKPVLVIPGSEYWYHPKVQHG
ncbi:conjugal transfer protein [Acidithiobacillus caldus]